MIFRTTTGRSTRTRFALGASLIALGGAVGIALPATAFAQETPAPDAGQDDSGDGGIIVTGIRASLASSAAIKRRSTLIVDSVSAEDVGKLPAVSIADSRARLPGVTAQRLEGRDQRLSIRGLGPDFSTTPPTRRAQVTHGPHRGAESETKT